MAAQISTTPIDPVKQFSVFAENRLGRLYDLTALLRQNNVHMIGLTVLEAAEDNEIAIPFECRSGICGQCKCKLISGRVVMDSQDALTAGDKAKGLILACQARPTQNCEIEA
jgi:ferredoxin